MPIIQPDTSAAVNMGPIEPGTYKAKITAVGYKTSKEKGTPMIVPEFEVNVNGEIRPRSAHLVITGKGAMGFDQLLRATGFDDVADKYRDPSQDNPPFDTDSLVGQELEVIIENEMYEGKKQDRIQGFMRA